MSDQTIPVLSHPGRQPVHPGIDEQMIETLVRGFYERVRADEVLGPIFGAVISDDWEPHLRKMMDFWSSVMLTTGRYKGQPMPKHAALKAVRPEHFERWLGLFKATAGDFCEEEIAVLFVERAERIAQSLQLGMFGAPEFNKPSNIGLATRS